MAFKFDQTDFNQILRESEAKSYGGFSVSLNGLQEVDRAIALLKDRIIAASAVGGKKVAFKILRRAKELVPFDTGDLSNTGRILDMAGDKVSADELQNYSVRWAAKTKYGVKMIEEWRVAFGGLPRASEPDSMVDYAAIVHENIQGYRFQNGRTDHYLTKAAYEVMGPDANNEIAKLVHEAINSVVATVPKTILTGPSNIGKPRLVKRS